MTTALVASAGPGWAVTELPAGALRGVLPVPEFNV